MSPAIPGLEALCVGLLSVSLCVRARCLRVSSGRSIPDWLAENRNNSITFSFADSNEIHTAVKA